jgi:hypothetical protein
MTPVAGAAGVPKKRPWCRSPAVGTRTPGTEGRWRQHSGTKGGRDSARMDPLFGLVPWCHEVPRHDGTKTDAVLGAVVPPSLRTARHQERPTGAPARRGGR